MDKKFICVFTEADRDRLLQAGFTLIREDQLNHLYQFVIDSKSSFALADIQYMLTNRLDF